MSDYQVIADVGDTLQGLLWERMRADPRIYPDLLPSAKDITTSSPEEMTSGNAGKLSLFLYRITPNAHLRNQEPDPRGAAHLEGTPCAVDLFYLVWAHTEDPRNDHMLLGKVLQVFHDHATLAGSQLRGCLAGTDQVLRVTLETPPFDETVHLWQCFGKESFRLSVCYRVTPIEIDSTRIREVKRVVEKQLVYATAQGNQDVRHTSL